MRQLFRRGVVTIATGIVGATIVWSSAMAQGEPPGRVGRLAFTNGTVSFHDDEQSGWTPAVVNTPLTTGDGIWTEPNARSEISLAGTRIRMEGATQLDMLALDDTQTRLQLAQGRIDVKSFAMDANQPYEIVTPRGTVKLLQQGDYYVEAGSTEDPTRLGVRSGAAQIQALNGQVLAVRADEVAEVMGDGASPQLRTIKTAPPAPPAYWASRDRQVVYDAPQYLSAGVTGYEDLNAYGDWINDGGYGRVWVPRCRAERLGALSHRALGLRAAVGLDLDRRAALGLRAVPLRPLGQSRQSLGLGAAAARCPPGLRSRAGGLRRRRRAGRDAGQPERRAGRLVPARSARSLRALLHHQPRLLSAPQPLGPHRGPHPRGSLAARAAARGVRGQPRAGDDEPALRHRGADVSLRALAAGDALGPPGAAAGDRRRSRGARRRTARADSVGRERNGSSIRRNTAAQGCNGAGTAAAGRTRRSQGRGRIEDGQRAGRQDGDRRHADPGQAGGDREVGRAGTEARRDPAQGRHRRQGETGRADTGRADTRASSGCGAAGTEGRHHACTRAARQAGRAAEAAAGRAAAASSTAAGRGASARTSAGQARRAAEAAGRSATAAAAAGQASRATEAAGRSARCRSRNRPSPPSHRSRRQLRPRRQPQPQAAAAGRAVTGASAAGRSGNRKAALPSRPGSRPLRRRRVRRRRLSSRPRRHSRRRSRPLLPAASGAAASAAGRTATASAAAATGSAAAATERHRRSLRRSSANRPLRNRSRSPSRRSRRNRARPLSPTTRRTTRSS